jgi:hypothetical protein
MARQPTVKQRLIAHIDQRHKGRLRSRNGMFVTGLDKQSLIYLQALHSFEHHKHAPDHHHGPNRGPDDRPPGWKTGEDAVLIERKGF